MRQLPIASILFRFFVTRVHSENSVCPRARRWLSALLVAATALTADVRAQEPGTELAEPTTVLAPKPNSAAHMIPLPRFVSRDDLLFDFDFDGLDAHVKAWVLVHESRGPSPEAGWVWWPEKDDLVISFMQPFTFDPRESQSGLLASLPGTLQARINTMAASSAAKAGAFGAILGAIAWPPVADGPAGGTVSGPQMPRNRLSSGEMGGSGVTPRGCPGAASRPDAPGEAGSGCAGLQEGWIQLKIGPTHLPKAEDLRALMFPGMLAAVADEQSIRLVTRESFPNLYASLATGAVALSLALPAIQAAHADASGGLDVGPGGMAPGQLGPGLPPAGQGSFPGAMPRTEGATAPPPDRASACGRVSPSRSRRPAPGNHAPG